MACFPASKGLNHDTPPPAPCCIDWDAYLLWMNMKFSSVDYRICQPQKTLAFARSLQHWAELANPPATAQPRQLAVCMIEWRDSMAPFTTFTDAEVFGEAECPCWVQVTPSKALEPEEPKAMWERSHGQNRRTHPWGSFSLVSNRGCTKGPVIPSMASAISSQSQGAPNISTQHRKMPPGSPVFQKQTPPPGFAEIAQSLRDDNPPQTTINVAQKQMPQSGFTVVAKSLREDKPPWITVKIP